MISKMHPRRGWLALLVSISGIVTAQQPRDPGIRPGGWAGEMMAGLTGAERELFRKGLEAFLKVNSVQGDLVIPETEAGLGPSFNMDHCAGCHAFPAPGGSSPPDNPQVSVAIKEGARNRVPAFVRPKGPIFQVRLRFSPNGTPDGSVWPIYTIAGRRDAEGCEIEQYDFSQELARNNLSFRIPPPLYGIGLIEAIPDSAILVNQAAEAEDKRKLGIRGTPGARLGWKAHGRSLEVFTAEAYLIEQGVTSELFPEEWGNPPKGCRLNPVPEDRKLLTGRRPADAYSNVARIAHYLRFLNPPVRAEAGNTEALRRGDQLFRQAGCSYCHTPVLHTGRSAHPPLSEKPVPLYSDLLLHHMGFGLADEIVQGPAGPDMFRTAPLWGLGQRIFLLHDGRTTDLVEAILSHADRPESRRKYGRRYPPSEANLSIERYRQLSTPEQQELLNFLRAL